MQVMCAYFSVNSHLNSKVDAFITNLTDNMLFFKICKLLLLEKAKEARIRIIVWRLSRASGFSGLVQLQGLCFMLPIWL